MLRCALIVCMLAASLAAGGEGKYTIKVAEAAPPKEIAEPIKKLLAKESVQLLDPAGKAVCEVWFRSQIPADATPEQIKNGLTHREVKQSELFGAIRFEQDWTDYRKNKVPAGVYTLRLGYQPMDGDHQGASDTQEFLLVLMADKDTKADTMDAKHMIDISKKSIGLGHPGVFMLFSHTKFEAKPSLAALPKDHWVVNSKAEVIVGGKKTGTNLGIGLTLVGAAE